ncbi:MAG: glycosyltransferase [Actinomycetota bacterium]|nr:glycosyltransferase [Actinomycetota bacterium]
MLFSRTRSERLPAGRQFALTWEIPDNFGGLTKAMLQRSHAFAESAGSPVSILTFSLQPNLDEVRADLRTRGLLGDGATLHNLWEDLRAMPDDMLREAEVDPQFGEPHDFDPAGAEPLRHGDVEFARVDRSEGQTGTTHVQILRADGTVVASQLWTRVGSGNPLCEFGDLVLETAMWASDGSFIGGWRGSWGLWNFWVGRQTAGEPSYAIVDSSVIADFMVHRGPGSTTALYLFHNNHLTRRREPPYAPLDRWRRYVSEHHTDFDALVFLTEKQRLDFGRLLGDVDNSHTVPNIVMGGKSTSQVEREEERAVVLARLGPQKRLDHALRAIAAASPSNPGLHLEIYGTGPREPQLRELATELNAPAAFHGYTDSPAVEFERSSFSLLTSTHEGFGLTLIESMAAGCVPLAYDVPYGPSDIITHGVDGYLVKAGDHKAMAKQINEFLALDPRTVAKMRKAGRKRAQDIAEMPIISTWGDAMRAARQRQATTTAPASPDTLSAEEKRAATTRFAATTAQAELIDASWPADDHLRMTVRVHPAGINVPPATQDVVARLIHRPTGASSPIPVSFPAGLDRRQDPPGSRYVVLDIDDGHLSGDLDHTIMIGLTPGDDAIWDVIRTRRHIRESLAFPAASARRPVVLFDKERGVELATASPKVSARVTVEGNDVSLKMELLKAGTIESVRATGLKGSPTIEADRDSTTTFRLELARTGTWEIRATVDGTARLVAWGSTSEELHAASDALDPVHIGAAPKGYLRLNSSPSRVVITDVGDDVMTQIFVASTQSPAEIVAVDAAHGEHHIKAVAQADGRHALDLSGLSEGTYRLRSATGDRIPMGDEAQGLLPRSTTYGSIVMTARRAARQNALVVEISALSDSLGQA